MLEPIGPRPLPWGQTNGGWGGGQHERLFDLIEGCRDDVGISGPLTGNREPGDELLVSPVVNLPRKRRAEFQIRTRPLRSPRQRGREPRRGCLPEICSGVRTGNSRPSGLVRTAADEKRGGSERRRRGARGRGLLPRRGAHLRVVLLVRAEGPVAHHHPVSVEAQLNGLLGGQPGPRGRGPHEALPLAGDDVQLPYPLQHQVKVHAEAGRGLI